MSIHPRILQGVAYQMSWQPQGSDGETATVDPGTVTVGVTSSDGTSLIAAGTATTGATTAPRVAPALTVAQVATPDILTATWKVGSTTVATTHVDVVGGYFFRIAELRGIEPALADPSEDTTTALSTIRDEVESSFEMWTNLAMVPRLSVVKAAGSNGRLCTGLFYPRSVKWARRIESDGTTTALTAAELSEIVLNDSGVLNWSGWCGKYQLGVEHGLDAPPPDGKRMAMLYARICASRAYGQGHSVTSFTTPDGQTVTYEPKADPTHYKIINEFLRRPGIDHRMPGIA